MSYTMQAESRNQPYSPVHLVQTEWIEWANLFPNPKYTDKTQKDLMTYIFRQGTT